VLVWEGARGGLTRLSSRGRGGGRAGRTGRVRVDVTLLDAAAMRRLNRRATGRRGLTDVLAFALPQPDGTLLGDVYICPAAAERWVTNGGRGKRDEGRVDEELIRLAVHGTLHVLGYDHPEGPGRVRSPMWRRQERYVRKLLGGGGGSPGR
jgi:probable rRNA maturation factor